MKIIHGQSHHIFSFWCFLVISSGPPQDAGRLSVLKGKDTDPAPSYPPPWRNDLPSLSYHCIIALSTRRIGPYAAIKKRPLGFERAFFDFILPELLAAGSSLREALAAVHGLVGLGLKGHSCLAAAFRADGSEELSGAAGSVFACITASLAALRIVYETFFSIEFLFACCEYELVSAFLAD